MILLLLLILTMLFANSTPAETKKYCIETPNPCTKLERIEENKIYLVSAEEVCAQVVGKMQVEIASSYAFAYIYLDGALWKQQRLQSQEVGYRDVCQKK